MNLTKLSLLLGIVSVVLTIAVVFLGYSLHNCHKYDYQILPTSTPLMSSTAETKSQPWESDFLLSKFIIPSFYEVTLYPELNTSTFRMNDIIYANVSKPMDYIYLHSDRINVTRTVIKQNGKEIPIKKTFEYIKNQYFVIILERNLEIGECILEFEGNGKLKKQDIVGFYESTYKNTAGEERKIASSKFEPTYARQAFLCFDEPDKKAKFSVKLVKPTEQYIALSNMRVKTTTDDSPSKGLSIVEFETSVPMSTYLVCFIVCDFKNLPPIQSASGFPITVYARDGQLENMEYAQKTAIGAINFFVDYFKVPYPLPKLDLIAIPDFVSGAMEHWGLVTFREAAVLFKKGSSSVGNKKRVAMTTSHELAHMWFGNLVTMDWWNNLWLNEGFASYMQYKALAVVEPLWEVDALFLTDMLHSTLQLDQTLSSHQIIQTVTNPDQITEIFDVISYQKGSSVIRMLENMMGADNFAKGVTAYLEEFKFKNADTSDLWNNLQKFTDSFNVTTVMDTYTRQMGYPIISVNRTKETVTFTQKRYLSNNRATYDADESPYKYKWDVYITYSTSKTPKEIQSVWLKRNASDVTITIPADTTWLKINRNQVGYFRVNYDETTWAALIEQLITDHTVLDPRDRANLLDDGFNLGDSQFIEYSTTFKLTQYLSKEDHYVPWAVMYTKLSKLEDRLMTTPGYEDYKKYVRCLLKNKPADNLWTLKPEDTFLEVSTKLVLNDLMCSFGVPACLKKAGDLLRNWFDTGVKPEADFRGLVYRFGMESTDSEEDYNKMWEKYRTESNPQEQIKMMAGLASVKNVALLEKFLEMAKDEKNIRSQDYFTVINLVAANPVGLVPAWNYVKTNWDYLVKRFGLNHRAFGRIIPQTVGKFSTEAQLTEVKDFFTQHPDAGAGAAGRKQALEMITNNIKWADVQGKKLQEWLKNNLCPDST